MGELLVDPTEQTFDFALPTGTIRGAVTQVNPQFAADPGQIMRGVHGPIVHVNHFGNPMPYNGPLQDFFETRPILIEEKAAAHQIPCGIINKGDQRDFFAAIRVIRSGNRNVSWVSPCNSARA